MVSEIFNGIITGMEWVSYALVGIVDRLFGYWGSSPTFSWGLTGLLLGTVGYFTVHEARKLSRPMLKPVLISSCLLLLVMCPWLGPKTGKRPVLEAPIVAVAQSSAQAATNAVQSVKSVNGNWVGSIGVKAAEFQLNQEGNQVSGNVKYGDVTETLSGTVSGGKISLNGTHWVSNSPAFSPDSFTGDISSDGKMLYGQYSDAAGNNGNWKAIYQGRSGKNKLTSQPTQAVDATQTANKIETSKQLFDKGQLIYKETPDEAIKYFIKSADKGYVKAQKRLGKLYYSGESESVPKDATEAAKWYRKAAENGDADAQCFYGSMLVNGVGVERDVDAGKAWLKKSADKGNADAKNRLEQLEGR